MRYETPQVKLWLEAIFRGHTLQAVAKEVGTAPNTVSYAIVSMLARRVATLKAEGKMLDLVIVDASEEETAAAGGSGPATDLPHLLPHLPGLPESSGPAEPVETPTAGAGAPVGGESGGETGEGDA